MGSTASLNKSDAEQRYSEYIHSLYLLYCRAKNVMVANQEAINTENTKLVKFVILGGLAK